MHTRFGRPSFASPFLSSPSSLLDHVPSSVLARSCCTPSFNPPAQPFVRHAPAPSLLSRSPSLAPPFLPVSQAQPDPPSSSTRHHPRFSHPTTPPLRSLLTRTQPIRSSPSPPRLLLTASARMAPSRPALPGCRVGPSPAAASNDQDARPPLAELSPGGAVAILEPRRSAPPRGRAARLSSRAGGVGRVAVGGRPSKASAVTSLAP